MNALIAIDSIVIIGRRWFDRTYGNTYHRTRVIVNGKNIGTSEMEYGYGDGYIQTAHEMLMNAGIYPRTGEHYLSGASKDWCLFSDDRIKHRDKFSISVSDVTRKRDLLSPL